MSRTYKPLLLKYLSKTRSYRYGRISLLIAPGVFHPGFFFSTKLLLKYIKGIPLEGRRLLELGAGSGLISFYAATEGARVTATDINPVAVRYLHENAERNHISLDIIPSDLFENIGQCRFDIIVINPPYYKKNPVTAADYAWYCGENGEYFSELFGQLRGYIHEGTEILMVLCDGCDLPMIRSHAGNSGFRLRLALTRPNLLEKNFIYKIVA